MGHREDAKSSLLYYLNQANDSEFRGDCVAEIAGIVDNIIDAAIVEFREHLDATIEKQFEIVQRVLEKQLQTVDELVRDRLKAFLGE